MANQLRAAFYLLGRNVYLAIAVLLVILQEACIVWIGVSGTVYGGQDSLIANYALPFICCFVAVGVAVEDDSVHGLRAAVCAQDGRARYAASRAVAVAVSTAVVIALALALDLVPAAVGHPELSLVVSAPKMHTPERLLAQYLSVLAFAELVLLVAWVSRKTSVALLVAFVVGIPRLALGLLLIPVALLPAPATGWSVDVAGVLGAISDLLPVAALTSVVSYPGGIQPVSLMGGYVVPFVWVAALLALGNALMARRTV